MEMQILKTGNCPEHSEMVEAKGYGKGKTVSATKCKA